MLERLGHFFCTTRAALFFCEKARNKATKVEKKSLDLLLGGVAIHFTLHDVRLYTIRAFSRNFVGAVSWAGFVCLN